MADELQDFVQHMLDSGAPKETIDEGIKLYQAQHAAPAAPLVRSRTGQMYTPPTEGASKDFIEGATSALNPMNYVRAAKAAWDHPVDSAIDAVKGVAMAPLRIAGGLITEPAKTLGGLTAGIATGAAVPLGAKPLARNVGSALEYVGEHPFATRMSGGAGVVAGVASGRPELVAGGLAAQALPGVATKAGQALRIYGGESPAVVRLGKPAVAKLNSQFDEAMVKRGMSFYDEQQAAKTAAAAETANAERLSAIEAAKEGRTASEPVVRESTVATQPDGTKASMSTTFKKAAAEADPNAPPPGWPPGVPYDPSRLGPVQPLRGGPKVTTLSDGRAPIRITGKAATDLADGTVPTASHAPMPTDTRLDEMVSKFAEGPKPARIPTQEGIPASKSKGPQSGTPGLTRADLEEAGLNPDLNYKDLTREMVDKIVANRASRHQTKYANAQSDRRFGTTRDDMKSILEQSLLLNMDRLR